MQAVTIVPRRPGSLSLDSIDEPPARQGAVLVRSLAVGVCGTDRELVDGDYGEAPPREERLILGHESLGRVVEAPAPLERYAEAYARDAQDVKTVLLLED